MAGKVYAVYARQSIDKKDSISIETQVEQCKGEIPSEANVAVYTDKGFSGSNTNRPSFKRLMQDIEKGKVNSVVCYKLDRISRSLLDFAGIVNIFNEYDVSFISCNERFDTSTPIGKAMLYIVMVFAELERETIRLRVTDSVYDRASKGFFIGGVAPYGFNKVPTTINGTKTSMFEADTELLPVIEKAYDMYANTNCSLRDIAINFNENGILSAKGRGWSSDTISKLLHSPVYVKANAEVYLYYKNKGCVMNNAVEEYVNDRGLYLYGHRENAGRKQASLQDHHVTIALHEGIIDAETWLKVKYKLESNVQIKNTGKSNVTWLSGLVRCGLCGNRVKLMTSRKKNSKLEYRYFTCSLRLSKKMCEGFANVVPFDVEDIVEVQLLKHLKALVNTPIETNKAPDRRIALIDNEIISIEVQIQTLINQLATGSTTVTRYINDKIGELDNRMTELNKDKELIYRETTEKNVPKQLVSLYNNWHKLSLSDKQFVASQCIEKIELLSDENRDTSVNVFWTSNFS